jgi:hypothetical protein
MSKSDDAQEAAEEVRNLVVYGDAPAKILIERIAPEYDVKADVVQAWLLREFESLAALDAWGAEKRVESFRAKEKRVDNNREREKRFIGLSEIINGMTIYAIEKTIIPQFTPWWKWIHANVWEPETLRHDAFDFARTLLKHRKIPESK